MVPLCYYLVNRELIHGLTKMNDWPTNYFTGYVTPGRNLKELVVCLLSFVPPRSERNE